MYFLVNTPPRPWETVTLNFANALLTLCVTLTPGSMSKVKKCFFLRLCTIDCNLVSFVVILLERERERQTDRQIQTDKQTDRERERDGCLSLIVAFIDMRFFLAVPRNRLFPLSDKLKVLQKNISTLSIFTRMS